VRIGATGDNEAQIAAFGHLLDFVVDAAPMGPGVSGVVSFNQQAHLFTGLLVLLLGLLDEWGGEGLQASVASEADGVVELPALAIGVEGGDGKAAVGAQFNRDMRPADAESGDQALQDGDNPTAGMHRPVA
jgi:hypothetical protein